MSNKGVNSRWTSQSSVILFALITFRNVTACNLWVIETAGFEPARLTYHKITSLIVVKVDD